jgi:uncharacterized protein (DUF934 family)
MLIDRNGRKPDRWTHAENGDPSRLSSAIVAWEAWESARAVRAAGQELGVLVPNTVSAAALRPFLAELGLIAVAFPAFSDGRGFSFARLLRAAGYRGTLRASGPLIADQFAYALDCGFDEIELPEASAIRQPPEQWLAAARAVSRGYQRGYAGRPSILDQRRAVRTAGKGARV